MRKYDSDVRRYFDSCVKTLESRVSNDKVVSRKEVCDAPTADNRRHLY